MPRYSKMSGKWKAPGTRWKWRWVEGIQKGSKYKISKPKPFLNFSLVY
jgi:hypothetical protein